MMRLVWSNLAKQELEKLRVYSIKNWGKDVAVQDMADIANSAKLIAQRPDRARVIKGDFRLLRVRSHYLLAHVNVTTEVLTIARVLHVTMDIERHLPREPE
jgi:plasmid stabilization system protein ParE